MSNENITRNNENESGGFPFPRRRFLATGIGAVVGSVGVGTRTAGANDPRFVRRIDVDPADMGLSAGVSETGERFAFGVETGVARVYDPQGNGQRVDIATDWGLQNMSITENRLSITFSAIDDDLFGRVMLNTDNEWAMDYPGLWEIDATPDLSSVAAGTYPNEGPGGAGLVTDGVVQWEHHFDEMAAYDVGVSETAEYVAVGGTPYSVGGEYEGQPSIRLYDADGSEEWVEETEGEGLDGTVPDVYVSEETEVIAAGVDGPDGGVLRAFNLDGDELWSEDGAGAWIGMSRDGSTVVGERDGEIVAFDGESGDELWTAGSGWFGNVYEVSDDGSRTLLVDDIDAQAVLIEQGSIEWQANFAVDYIRGALAGDGSAWGVIMGDNDAGQAIIQVY